MMNTAAKSTCPGCKRVFTYCGLSQHIATTNHIHCCVVHAASLPQSLGGSPPHEQALLTLTPNSTSQNHPDLFFGREHPSGHDRTPYDSPDLLLSGLESVMTENMGDSKFALHQLGPCTKPATDMSVDYASNSTNNQGNHTADGDGAPNMADIIDTDTFETSADTNYTIDGDGTPDVADVTEANVFEILAQTQSSRLAVSNLTVPNPEQILLAKLESPLEDLPNLLERSSPDAHPLVAIEHFPHGNPGAPIEAMQGSSIYKSSQEGLGGSVWAPFQSECDWCFAYWAKMNKLSSLALTDLLAIPNVSLPFFSLLRCSM